MRLLDVQAYISTRRLQIKEFFDPDIPNYAILSHRWDKVEATFQDVNAHHITVDDFRTRKLRLTLDQAHADGLRYVWVDTCCIDKTSSAELSEAINSMFQWYKNSSRCYAYLRDFPGKHPHLIESSEGKLLALPVGEPQSTLQIKPTRLPDNANKVESGAWYPLSLADQAFWLKDLEACQWFYRGWTLQELIAPQEVFFFGQTWNSIGTRSQLARTLSDITGINAWVLQKGYRPGRTSVAKRLSWAAQRTTSREEDKAYCLLGLLEVNMTLLYGEKDKAFARLQKKIIKSSPDCSILAWQRSAESGILAPSPADFSLCNRVILCDLRYPMIYEITNRGLKFSLPLLKTGPQRFLAILACRMEDDYRRLVAIHLKQRQTEGAQEQDAMQCSIEACTKRCDNIPGPAWPAKKVHTILSKKSQSAFHQTVLVLEHNFRSDTNVSQNRDRPSVMIQTPHIPTENKLDAVELYPEHQWNLDTLTMSGYRSLTAKDDPEIGVAHLRHKSGAEFVVSFAVFEDIQFLKVSKADGKPFQKVCQRLITSMRASRHVQRYTTIRIYYSANHFVDIEAIAIDGRSYGELVQLVDITITEGERRKNRKL